MVLEQWIPVISATLFVAALAVAVVFATGRIRSAFLASLVCALLLTPALMVQLGLAVADGPHWGLLMLLLGPVMGGLLLRSEWWPLLCPAPLMLLLMVAVLGPQDETADSPAWGPMVGPVLLGVLVLAGLAAMGVALGRRFWPLDT